MNRELFNEFREGFEALAKERMGRRVLKRHEVGKLTQSSEERKTIRVAEEDVRFPMVIR